MVTANDIKAIIEAGIENDPIPDAILGYLRTRHGKLLTERDAKKLQATVDPSIRIRKESGMTHLTWASCTPGWFASMLIAHEVGSPVINADAVKERNTWCFTARIERNAKRAAALIDSAKLGIAADLINTINSARASLDTLLEYDGPLYVESLAIGKLVTK